MAQEDPKTPHKGDGEDDEDGCHDLWCLLAGLGSLVPLLLAYAAALLTHHA